MKPPLLLSKMKGRLESIADRRLGLHYRQEQEHDDLAHSIDMEETKLRVLTLNVWGLKFISPDRPARIQGIIDHIRQPIDVDADLGIDRKSSIAYDVVCLQELWIYSDYERVRDGLEEVLPESKFFRRYVRVRSDVSRFRMRRGRVPRMNRVSRDGCKTRYSQADGASLHVMSLLNIHKFQSSLLSPRSS